MNRPLSDETDSASSPVSPISPTNHNQQDMSSFNPRTSTSTIATDRSMYSNGTVHTSSVPTPDHSTTSEAQISSHIDDPLPSPWTVYWLSPTLMLALFVSGVSFALGHHFYYLSLTGKEVPDTSDDTMWDFQWSNLHSQQWALRFGTSFAFLTKFCLATSVSSAYTQWIWRTFRTKSISVEGLDAALSIEKDLWSFFNRDVVLRMKLGCTLALIAWLIPLSAIIAPTTLTVELQLQANNSSMNVPGIDINSPRGSARFAYVQPSNPVGGWSFINPTSTISRLFAATGASAQILPIRPPAANASYSLEFYGPSVKCDTPSSGIKDTILMLTQTAPQTVLNATSGSSDSMDMQDSWSVYYNAFVPVLSKNGQPPSAGYLNSGNNANTGDGQMWLYYISEDPTTGLDTEITTVCNLYNSSYTVDFVFQENEPQSVTVTKRQEQNLVNYVSEFNVFAPNETYSEAPLDDQPYFNQANISYSAYMMQLEIQLAGILASSHPGASRGDNRIITTSILSTALAGSKELQSFIKKIANPGQILSDTSLARNRTLQVLIEELAMNYTLSMMSESFVGILGPQEAQKATVMTTKPINVYAYHRRNLFIAYGLAIAAAFLGVLVGGYALHLNGVAHSLSFSAILCTTRNQELDALVGGSGLGKLPLRKDIGKTRLRFGKLKSQQWVDDKGRRVAHTAFGKPESVELFRKGDSWD